ncbi:hypothetical protein [Anaeromicropila herbilytica]|uniref:Cysteine-rich CPCC domain-containing protein n=1 Tax=Anaeromicropila herbilytica TaxID=2785025 RepID=A0A7R7EIF0_9FIRM|nr:hypothetical protein [Anaeromicropila herbilytica]BCN29441.1 hypothetical protein bsdtb5_07360 [Anaeromicropila herbilytica]
MYICLICGYNGLENPLYDDDDGAPSFTICDCCGFESGYDDLDQGNSFDEYRKIWISGGCQWHTISKKPKNWNADVQIKNLVNR